MAELFVLSGADVGRSFEVKQGDTIGRSPDCILVLKDRSISRRHAHLEEHAGTWKLCDDESRNGIAIGAVKHTEVELPDGQEFLLGEVLMRFRCAHDAPSREEIEAVDTVTLTAGGGSAARAPQPPAAPPAPPAPAVEPADEIVLEGADEIELGAGKPSGDLSQTYVNPRVAPPAPVSPDAKKIGLGPPSRERLAEQRGRVLQYHREAESDSLFSFELSQLPVWLRLGLYALALALLVGVFGVTFFGTSFLRGKLGGGGDTEFEQPRTP